MTNREYLRTLTSYEIARYVFRLVRDKAIISPDGIINSIRDWLDSEHTEEFDKERYINW